LYKDIDIDLEYGSTALKVWGNNGEAEGVLESLEISPSVNKL
jgi:hypothetical protein